MKRHVAALRRAAEVIEVPGTPRTLRIDEVRERPTELAVRWSFEDPEAERPGSGRGRVQGHPHRDSRRDPRRAPRR